MFRIEAIYDRYWSDYPERTGKKYKIEVRKISQEMYEVSAYSIETNELNFSEKVTKIEFLGSYWGINEADLDEISKMGIKT